MSKYLIAVIDGAKARFFTLEPIDETLPESRSHLIEHQGLWNSTQELSGRELWTDTKTGRNQSTGSKAHAYDDGRQNHQLEYERRFVRSITQEMMELIQLQSIRQLVLVAEAQILGILRDLLVPLLPKNLNIQIVTKDLCKFKAVEIHEYLAAQKIIPIY